jgi:predicted small secreted protein
LKIHTKLAFENCGIIKEDNKGGVLMKIRSLFALVMILAATSLMTGCQNTVHGMGQDMDRITGS